MTDKFPRWTYVAIFALLIVVVVLTARAVVRKKSAGVASTPPAEQSAKDSTGRDVAEKDQQIQELKTEIAGLRKEVEANSKKARELESRLDETRRAFSSAQQKLKVAQKQADRVVAAPSSARSAVKSVEPAPSQARERTVAKSAAPAPTSSARRPTEAGSYEIIRDTAVLEKPSVSSREVALIQQGTIVNVVGSRGEWLEVRSKHGKPPGYIRHDDAMFRQAQGDVIR
jgi:small-conductance mechanosensitive channel